MEALKLLARLVENRNDELQVEIDEFIELYVDLIVVVVRYKSY